MTAELLEFQRTLNRDIVADQQHEISRLQADLSAVEKSRDQVALRISDLETENYKLQQLVDHYLCQLDERARHLGVIREHADGTDEETARQRYEEAFRAPEGEVKRLVTRAYATAFSPAESAHLAAVLARIAYGSEAQFRAIVPEAE